MPQSVPVGPQSQPEPNTRSRRMGAARQSRRLLRLVEHFGWTDLIYTHISARVPGEPGHFLLNRFGLLFDEVTASNLIKVDLDGNLVEEPMRPCTRRDS